MYILPEGRASEHVRPNAVAKRPPSLTLLCGSTALCRTAQLLPNVGNYTITWLSLTLSCAINNFRYVFCASNVQFSTFSDFYRDFEDLTRTRLGSEYWVGLGLFFGGGAANYGCGSRRSASPLVSLMGRLLVS